MTKHLQIVADNKERLVKPSRLNRAQLLSFVRAARVSAAPFLRVPLWALRYIAYLTLLFVRMPMQVVCRLCLMPLIVGAVLWGFIKGWTSMPTIVMAGGAFTLFLFSYLYDSVLLFIAPEKIDLEM